MSDRLKSRRPVDPDTDDFWLTDNGAEISIESTKDQRAIDIVKAVGARHSSKEK